MLGLKFETSTSWAEIAKNDLQQILTDHAFADKKLLRTLFRSL